MRSLTFSDSAKGLLVCIVLVAAMLYVVHVINRHAEEHGHCAPLAMLDVVLVQRDQAELGRKPKDVVHGAKPGARRGPCT